MAELNQTLANAAGRKRAKPLGARVDLTAMVDLPFLLVTFFMLTTRLEKPKAMDLAMPDLGGGNGEVAESRTLTVCLGADNKVLWYRGLAKKPLDGPHITSYAAGGLRKTMLEIKQRVEKETGRDLIVLVKPAEHSNYGNLVSTLDEIRINDVNIYAVVETAKEDIGLLKARNVW